MASLFRSLRPPDASFQYAGFELNFLSGCPNIGVHRPILPTAAPYNVTWQRPEAPDGISLIHQIANGRLNITVPDISPWSVLSIE